MIARSCLRFGLFGLLFVTAQRAHAQSAPGNPGITVAPSISVQQPTPGIRVGQGMQPQFPSKITTLPEDFGPNLRGPQPGNVVQPIFNLPGGDRQNIDNINAMVNRAISLGTVAPNYKRIAETLDKGFPNLLGPDTLDDQAKRKAAAKENIRLADLNDQIVGPPDPDAPVPVPAPKPADIKPNPIVPAQNGNGNGSGNLNGPDNGFKQTIDEINKIFKTQAELIRSIDVGSVRRNGEGAVDDGSVVVVTGRTGLQLALIPETIYEHVKVPRDQGLMITEVFAKTPAELAGYRKNDILMELNGRKVPNNLVDFLNNVMSTVRNDVPFTGVVLRGGERIEIGEMKVTDRRVVPALPNERIPDFNSIIQVVPGINSDQQNTNRVPEFRMIRTQTPTGITTEIIRVDPGKR